MRTIPKISSASVPGFDTLREREFSFLSEISVVSGKRKDDLRDNFSVLDRTGAEREKEYRCNKHAISIAKCSGIDSEETLEVKQTKLLHGQLVWLKTCR